MTTPAIVDEAENLMRNRFAELTQVRDNECLLCYVARLVDEFPCDGQLTHTLRYRDAVAPRATALRDRLGRVGGFCDCEIFLNGYQLLGSDEHADIQEEADDEDAVLFVDDIVDQDAGRTELPPCQGARRNTVKPCGNWVRIRRW